ncbi:MAG: hypothetical protein HYU58_17680 [Proteobacteria bacterium]|nr:hypothetical protein [Pseudomonadota bacterium]
MPEANSRPRETEIPLPHVRGEIAEFAARHELRPIIVGFIATWFAWVEKLGRVPSRSELDPANLKAFLRAMRVIRIEPGKPEYAGQPGLAYRYFYRLIGTDHRRHDDRDFTHTYLDETNLSLQRVAFLGAAYERIIDRRWPILMNHDHFGSGTGIYACQRMICPLAEPGGAVTDLFGVWSYGRLIASTDRADEITRTDLLRNQNLTNKR